MTSRHGPVIIRTVFHNQLLHVIRDETEQKRTELSAIIFVFIFFCRSGNEYRNPGNEYGSRYYQKQTRSEYKADTETKIDIDRNLKTP